MATHVPQQAPHINSLNANGTQAPVIGTPSSAFGNHMFQSLSCAQHTSTTQYFTASANMPPLSSFDAGAAGHHNIGAGAVAYRQQLGPKRRRASQPCLGGGAGASRRTLDADILARIRPPSPEAKFTRKGGKDTQVKKSRATSRRPSLAGALTRVVAKEQRSRQAIQSRRSNIDGPPNAMPSSVMSITAVPSNTMPSITMPITAVPSNAMPSSTMPITTVPSNAMPSTPRKSPRRPTKTLSSVAVPAPQERPRGTARKGVPQRPAPVARSKSDDSAVRSHLPPSALQHHMLPVMALGHLPQPITTESVNTSVSKGFAPAHVHTAYPMQMVRVLKYDPTSGETVPMQLMTLAAPPSGAAGAKSVATGHVDANRVLLQQMVPPGMRLMKVVQLPRAPPQHQQ